MCFFLINCHHVEIQLLSVCVCVFLAAVELQCAHSLAEVKKKRLLFI